MKRITVAVVIICILLYSGTCFADSLFDEIMALPDAETEQEDSTVDFDSFINDFSYYCESWGDSFDKTDKQTIKNDESETVIVLDGVEFDIAKGDGNPHPINWISVDLGKDKTDYSSTVKMLAVIAVIEFGLPDSAAERSLILNQIKSECDEGMELAFSMAKYDVPMPSFYPSKEHCYTIEYDEDEGYRFVAILTDENEENAQEIPIEIISATAGESAMFAARNKGDEPIAEITFRIRGYDSDGNYINIGTEDQTGALNNMNLFTAPFDDNSLKPGACFHADLSIGKQAALSDNVELAVQGYKTEDGSSYAIPESQLHWFSSKNGYEDGSTGSFSYEYPPQSIFEKGGSFNMGVSTESVFPEDPQEVTGYLIDGIGDGFMASYDVQVGDVIYGANGILIHDDPFAVEKAKAEYADGKDIVLMIKRGEALMDVTIPV